MGIRARRKDQTQPLIGRCALIESRRRRAYGVGRRQRKMSRPVLVRRGAEAGLCDCILETDAGIADRVRCGSELFQDTRIAVSGQFAGKCRPGDRGAVADGVLPTLGREIENRVKTKVSPDASALRTGTIGSDGRRTSGLSVATRAPTA